MDTSHTVPRKQNSTGIHLRQRWEGLTAPHPSLTRIEQRRQSQLLSQLTLAISALSLIGSFALIVRGNGRISETVIGLWIGIFLTLGFYGINRRGYYQASAILFIGLNFLLIHFGTLLTGEPAWFFFAGMLVIIGAALLPLTLNLVLVALSVVTQIALWNIAPVTLEVNNFVALVVFGFTALMIFVFVSHRTGLEKEQRAALEIANQQLRHSETLLEQRVAARTYELQAAKEQAEAARERAEHADRVKSQFLANISHELRTPLNAVLNFTEFVQMELLGTVNEAQKDALDKALGSGQHLLALINDLLDMTKIDSGMMRLFIQPDIDLYDLLAPILPLIPTLRGEKPIQLITDIDPDLPILTIDQRRIRQVLLNLLSNAFKFSEQGSVTVSVKRHEEYVLFGVSDTGSGIAPADQELIFQPFVQRSSVKHTSQNGTGLGLAISRWLINAHGGKLWLESDIGDGAAFYFTLPIEHSVTIAPVTDHHPNSFNPSESVSETL